MLLIATSTRIFVLARRIVLTGILSFDVGLPTECDDEFWDHPDPEQAWKQPPGPPSKVSFFISFIKQTSILATVLEFEVSLFGSVSVRY